MARFYISVGANLGDREQSLRKAIDCLRRTEGIDVAAVSPWYETPPWGKTDQPPFLNGAAAVDTDMSGQDLLDICLSIEKELGRVRHEKWGARVIDIDLVYSPDERSCTETLKLPHPYMLERAFVLVPLRDIAPDLMLEGKSIDQWIDGLPDAGQVKVYV